MNLRIKKKLQKGIFRNKESNANASKIFFGEYAIQSCTKGILSYNQMDAVRKIINKNIKGVGKLWVRFWPTVSRTKKPLEMRMGKGKGNVEFWISQVKAGTILFEINKLILTTEIKKSLFLAMKKLPLKSKLIQRKA